MITILRGPRAGLARFGVASDLTTRWDATADAPAWGALRGMTAALRAALGDDTVRSAMQGLDGTAPIVALSLAMRALEPSLTPAQTRARSFVSGALLAQLPRAHPRTNPVSRAWADLVAQLTEGRMAVAIAPEVERVDLSTLRAARTVLSRARGTLSVLVGHDTLVTSTSPFETWIRKLKVRELSLFEALPYTHIERVDLRAEPVMARRGGGTEEREPKTLDTMRAAFDAYAFDVALRLAIELSPKLEGADLREAHALAALSAMSLDPHGKRDDFGMGMAEAGFRGALDGEADPKKRAHWALQLSFVYARARGEIDTALAYANQAVSEAEVARARYLEAWARLARAQAKLHAERPEEAAADLEAALARLDDPTVLRDTPKAFLDSTRAVLASERARVAARLGRRDDLRHYRRLTEASLAALPAAERPGCDWVAPLDDELAPSAARTWRATELQRARDGLDIEEERVTTRALAGAELLIGDAAAAKEHLAAAMRISALLKRPPEEMFGLRLESIFAEVRAGAWEEAERDLSLVRADPHCEGDAAQAEALAMLALVAAGRKDAVTAAERAANAVVQVERSKSSGAIARVTKIAADVHLALGRKADARALAEKAHAALRPDDASSDALGVLVTILDCGGASDAMVAEAVMHAPGALLDVSAWWELPRLLHHVKRVLPRSGDVLDGHALGAILAAAGQRPDCAELVAQIRAALS